MEAEEMVFAVRVIVYQGDRSWVERTLASAIPDDRPLTTELGRAGRCISAVTVYRSSELQEEACQK